ncbi:MAG: nucleotidyltransferase domain-containing protein [Spirochaetes bacterium]|nr:nucleotidyltransferase domain-containing protein [Spirochaetota bacterium]
MAHEEVVTAIRHYLRVLGERGIPVRSGVLFGSWARDEADEWSDIDLVVVSPVFDARVDHDEVIKLLWRVAARTDSRIEPVPCGERQWLEDQSSAIIEIARREGQIILADAA